MNAKLTLNYGLRLDVINPQTVNEPGNGGFLDLDTGEITSAASAASASTATSRTAFNWAPRVGVTYQLNERTVSAAGYGRSYDIGVFGSLFGHSVTQNLPVLSVQELNAPTNFDRVFTLAQGPAAAGLPGGPVGRPFPVAGRRLHPGAAREAAAAARSTRAT